MTSVAIITSIIVLLAVLVCYAFIVQTLNQKKQQKNRILQAMTTRARNFKFMLNGFPKGFLPKDLTILVLRSLVDVLETLKKLEPDNAAHGKELTGIRQQLNDAQRNTTRQEQNITIDNPQQSREIKACLEELYKFVFHLEAKKQVSREEAENYRALIKQMVLRMTIDSYVLHGRAAKEKDKPQLAIHYFDLAYKLMHRERGSGLFDNRMAQMQAAIQELKGQASAVAQKPGKPKPTDGGENTISEEWDEFEKEEAGWKKKQIYD